MVGLRLLLPIGLLLHLAAGVTILPSDPSVLKSLASKGPNAASSAAPPDAVPAGNDAPGDNNNNTGVASSDNKTSGSPDELMLRLKDHNLLFSDIQRQLNETLRLSLEITNSKKAEKLAVKIRSFNKTYGEVLSTLDALSIPDDKKNSVVKDLEDLQSSFGSVVSLLAKKMPTLEEALGDDENTSSHGEKKMARLLLYKAELAKLQDEFDHTKASFDLLKANLGKRNSSDASAEEEEEEEPQEAPDGAAGGGGPSANATSGAPNLPGQAPSPPTLPGAAAGALPPSPPAGAPPDAAGDA